MFEWPQVIESSTVLRWTQLPFACLQVSGNDHIDFLHKQVTSDLVQLAPDQAQYSAWCTSKGRVLVNWLHVRLADQLLALMPPDQISWVMPQLQRYILRAKVRMADVSSQWVAIGCMGEPALLQESLSVVAAAAAVSIAAGMTPPSSSPSTTSFSSLSLPEQPMQWCGGDALLCVRIDRHRLLYLIRSECYASIQAELSARFGTEPSHELWQAADIANGIAWIAAANREAFVPQMLDLERIGALSFKKGCYPGQEIVARSQYLGRIKRHLCRFYSTESPANQTAVAAEILPGSALYAPAPLSPTSSPSQIGERQAVARVVNVLRTAEGWLGLTVVSEERPDATEIPVDESQPVESAPIARQLQTEAGAWVTVLPFPSA